MKNTKNLFSLAVLLLLAITFSVSLNSCKEPDEPQPVPTNLGGVFILNEGSFLKGNASVDFLDLETNTLTENLFEAVNKRPLGDIFQSITKVNSLLYLVVNNSSKIEVVKEGSFISEATIDNLGSPRYMLPLSTGSGPRAYVTDLFNNEIHIVSLATHKKIGSIALPGWSEHMLLIKDSVYVTNWSNNKIYKINTLTDAIIDSITLTGPPLGIAMDINNEPWVLVDSSGNNNAKFVRIDPFNDVITNEIEFPKGKSASKFVMSESKLSILYINATGLFEVGLGASSVPNSTPIKAGDFYGLGVDPTEGSIYVTEVLNFTQKGVVHRIKPDKTETNFRAGIGPGGFFFNK